MAHEQSDVLFKALKYYLAYYLKNYLVHYTSYEIYYLAHSID